MNLYSKMCNDSAELIVSDEREFYVLATKGGEALPHKNREYYTISKNIVNAYDVKEGCMLNRGGLMKWPVAVEQFEEPIHVSVISRKKS